MPSYLDDVLVVGEKVHDVGDGAGHPAAPLVVELVEGLGRVREGVGGGAVLDAVALLEQQGAEPAVLALVELHVVARLARLRLVHAQHVVVDEGGAAEEREAAGRAHDAAEDVLGRLLQPVADRVLELLVPYHGPRADRVDAATGGAHLGQQENNVS